MMVRVEFYGIPRSRAGVAAIDVEGATLGEVLDQLAVRLPPFAQACLRDGHLKPGYLASIGGRRFTTDRGAAVSPADAVLILSADAGG